MTQTARKTIDGDAVLANPSERPTMAEFFTQARVAPSLEHLTGAFAALIAPDGFLSHVCIASAHGAIEPLFGDAALQGRRTAPRLELPVQSWDGKPRAVRLIGRVVDTPPDMLARLRGAAEVYATFGVALHERAADLATSAGIGLIQRQCFAQLLIGRGEGWIAETLGLQPITVAAHIADAIRVLGVENRAEAIAYAARRGWLAGLSAQSGTFLTRH